jgi:DtxR family Mn-dependent transcriptional regulator
MVKRLAQLGLVTHEPYRGVALTGAGRDAAEHIAHRNRLVIEYLVNVLGYAECDAPGEADQIEHALSERLTARIAARLGSA